MNDYYQSIFITVWLFITTVISLVSLVVLAIKSWRTTYSNLVNLSRSKITKVPIPGIRSDAYLEVLEGESDLKDKKILLYTNTITPVGRSPEEAEIVFGSDNEHSLISRRHCEFRGEGSIFKIRDLGSANGTFVNGIKLQDGGEGLTLVDGDRIALGPVKRGGILLRFTLSDSDLRLPHSNTRLTEIQESRITKPSQPSINRVDDINDWDPTETDSTSE